MKRIGAISLVACILCSMSISCEKDNYYQEGIKFRTHLLNYIYFLTSSGIQPKDQL